MHWVLQRGFLAESSWATLIETLERFGVAYSIHDVLPKRGDLLPEPVIQHKNVFCIGSYSMRHVAARHGWTPGIFDLYAQDFEVQRSHWGEHMLNYHSTVCALKDAHISSGRMFIRPTKDTKYFSGKVFEADEFTLWQASICAENAFHNTSLSPTTHIQLARPIQIYAEYRFWVVGREIITQSLYKRGKQVIYASEVDERVTAFVKDRIGEWAPHESFVIDACDCEAGLKIVEINTLNSAGFYAADVQRLVLALEDRYTQEQ